MDCATHPQVPNDGRPRWHSDTVETTELRAPSDTIEITCPRCGSDVAERFYGPCLTCRSDLRARLGGERRDVAVAAYEPKMNVTPNAVATKD